MKNIVMKESACLACGLCRVYCQVKHSPTTDVVKTFLRYEAPQPRLRIETDRPACFSVRCQHCEDPECVKGCLTGALSKDSLTGIVDVDHDKCMGCWTCTLLCPFGSLIKDKKSGKISKCNLCADKSEPQCVKYCPNGALLVAEV
ncbi:MAG: 4Fe-4S dicluster domain-containing protein [Chloroflexi bacterium]|nr:4Fe-4S dicluster domain-containing protein [Chloroflexota bacterium]